MPNIETPNNPDLLFLLSALLKAENETEMYEFLKDLCTQSEIEEMTRRLLAARMLRGNMVYNEIAERTHLSTATISRVNRELKYGDGGYNTILARMEQEDKYL